MKYQVIIQFDSSKDFDFLIDIEDRLEKSLNAGVVDGDDFGSDEMNVFLYTNAPEETFKQIESIVRTNEMAMARIAYRKVLVDDFQILWPKDLKSFSIS